LSLSCDPGDIRLLLPRANHYVTCTVAAQVAYEYAPGDGGAPLVPDMPGVGAPADVTLNGIACVALPMSAPVTSVSGLDECSVH
jgi:hypothetical protein